MKKTLFFVTFVILISIPFVGGDTAHATSCTTESTQLEWSRDNADIVFRGTVTHRSDAVSAAPSQETRISIIDFKANEYWKGSPTATVVVSAPTYPWGSDATPDNAFFQEGKEYLVFAKIYTGGAAGQPRIYTTEILCGGNREIRYATEFLRKLDAGTKPTTQTPTQPTPTPTQQVVFSSNLTVGNSGNAVVALQAWLESQGFLKIPAGIAKGYFGLITRGALAQFQTSVGISPAVGYFGPITRAYLNTKSQLNNSN